MLKNTKNDSIIFVLNMNHSWFVSKEERLGMKKSLFTIIFIFLISFYMRFDDMSVVQAANLREEALKLAADEVGYLEKESMDNLYDDTANAGTNNYTKYAVELCVAYGQPWNATFFWWVMSSAGVPREAYPNRTTVTSDWYKDRGMFRETTDYIPQPGDYIILGDRMQCGLVESVDVEANTVTYIAGNVSDSVARVTRDLDDEYIYGYGLIDYDYVYQPTGLDLGDNYCAMLFKTSASKYFRNYEDNPVLWSEVNRADYRWLFKKQEDGTYVIQSLYDGKVLEVKNAGTARNSQISLGEFQEENNEHQKWYIITFGVGYRLIPQNNTNSCLEMLYDNDGAGMHLWNHHDGMQHMVSITGIDYIGLTGLTIDADYDKTMYVGDKQILDYELKPSDASSDMVCWVSSDNSVAEVSEDGIVVAKKEGIVTILCKSTFDNTISDKIVIQVKSKSTEPEVSTEENATTTESSEASTEKPEISTEKQETSTEKPETSTEQTDNDNNQQNTVDNETQDSPVKKGHRIKGKQCWFSIISVKKKTVKVISIKNKKTSNVRIPSTVKYKGKTYKVVSVGENAFKDNKYLKSVTIGDNVTSIHESAFRGCKKLKKIVIGKKVTVIGKKAFYNCTRLKVIKIKSTKLKKIGSKAFKKIDKNPTIYAPKAKMKKYQKLFKGKI